MQSSVESSILGAEFCVTKTMAEIIEALRYKLRILNKASTHRCNNVLKGQRYICFPHNLVLNLYHDISIPLLTERARVYMLIMYIVEKTYCCSEPPLVVALNIIACPLSSTQYLINNKTCIAPLTVTSNQLYKINFPKDQVVSY